MPLDLDTKSLIIGLVLGLVVVPVVRAKLAARKG